MFLCSAAKVMNLVVVRSHASHHLVSAEQKPPRPSPEQTVVSPSGPFILPRITVTGFSRPRHGTAERSRSNDVNTPIRRSVVTMVDLLKRIRKLLHGLLFQKWYGQTYEEGFCVLDSLL
nr:hypothetical protein CFP56_00693 [Quercus suber]